MEPRAPKTCPRCQASFECGLSEGHQACWCFECPRVMPVVEEADCLCPDCLQAEIAERTKPQPNTLDSAKTGPCANLRECR